jgi:hypothetical protein
MQDMRSGTCDTQGSDGNAYNIWLENYMADLDLDGRIILNWKVKKCRVRVHLVEVRVQWRNLVKRMKAF